VQAMPPFTPSEPHGSADRLLGVGSAARYLGSAIVYGYQGLCQTRPMTLTTTAGLPP
jgi:hypothetical protein